MTVFYFNITDYTENTTGKRLGWGSEAATFV